MLKDIIKLNEPLWGEKLLIILNDFVNKNYILTKIIPFTADVFVLSYPFYLTIFYLYGVYKKDVNFKNGALYIFFSTASSVFFNLFLQYFIDKDRPEQLALSKENLIFEHLPSKPFPSDHAAVSAAIAMSTMLWGYKNKNKKLILLGVIFWIFSLIMSFSRVAAGVHWPTDIIIGTLVGIIFSLIFIKDNIYNFLVSKIFSPLISIEKWIFKKLFNINQ